MEAAVSLGHTDLNISDTNCKYSPWASCLSLSEAFVTVASMLSVMLVIVFGNLMVVLTVNNDQKLRSQRQNWLIVSLALADLLVGLLVMPLTMIYEIVGLWVLGNLLCELWLALDVLFVTASILHICIISLDRYWSVTQPLTYPTKRTPLFICVMIGVAWLVSLLICFPPILGWRPQRKPGECSVSQDLGYVLYSSLGSFYIPVGILALVYWRIFVITKNHSRQRLKDTARTDETLCQLTAQLGNQNAIFQPVQRSKGFLQNGKTSSASEGSSPDIQLSLFSHIRSRLFSQSDPAKCNGNDINQKKKSLDKRRRLLKVKERQATLILGLIFTAFIASWLPFFIMYVLGAFGYQAPILAFKFFFWLGYCNSAINPIIYTVFNKEFKRALFRLLRRHQHYFLFLKPHVC
ncbi:7 transmembrane receptor (rhodopsin family) domain-containing protein [Ditylenchus destructor]|nr:7 transmembrane receptor (rhodopsin family) domain-containing protein [Ditylenchus destructor]